MRSALLSVCLLLLVCSAAPAQDFEVLSLTGWSAIDVGVEGLSEEAIRMGLSDASLRDQVESRLRGAGIRIDENVPNLLFVRVTAIERLVGGESVGYSASVECDFSQWVTTSYGYEGPGITWRRGGILAGPLGGLLGQVRTALDEYLDAFINDYYKANPRQ